MSRTTKSAATVNATTTPAPRLRRRNGTTVVPVNATPNTTPAPVNATPAAPVVPDAIIKTARGITVATIIPACRTGVTGATVANRNVGRFTGMRVMAFQNATMEWNRVWGLDDVQLAYVWTMEFPTAIGNVFGLNGRMAGADNVNATTINTVVSIIRGVRSHYNRTGHGGPIPASPSVSFGPNGRTVAPVAPVATPAPVVPVVPVATTKRGRGRKPAAA